MASDSGRAAYKQHLDDTLSDYGSRIKALEKALEGLQGLQNISTRLASFETRYGDLLHYRERDAATRQFILSIKREVEQLLRGAGTIGDGDEIQVVEPRRPGSVDAGGVGGGGRQRFMDTLSDSQRAAAQVDGERGAADQSGA